MVRDEAMRRIYNRLEKRDEEETQSLGAEGRGEEQNAIHPSLLIPKSARASSLRPLHEIPKLAATSSNQRRRRKITARDRSEEPERQLRQAEMHIVELQQQAAVWEWKTNQQRQMQSFKKKRSSTIGGGC
jgi:hypothetical protein